jgi:hypothetical protein
MARGARAGLDQDQRRRRGLAPRRGRMPHLDKAARPAQFSGNPPGSRTAMDDKTRTELEAAAFRRLVQHLRERTDVQNIDLMNLAGFCRNCLSKWYLAAAQEKGVALTDPEAREIVYGMPYEDWKKKHQKEANAEQKAKLAVSHKH